jgi:hypothetical protein
LEGGASPTIRGCLFTQNEARRGGAVYLDQDCAPSFSDCRFLDNRASDYGGALNCAMPGANAAVSGCLFARNEAGISGGAISAWNENLATLSGCTLHGNRAPAGGGCALRWGAAPIVERTIIAFSEAGGAFYCEDTSLPMLSCCDLFGNAGGDWSGPIAAALGQDGNVALDPLFCNVALDDFTLCSNSPCAAFSAPNAECDQVGAAGIGCATCAPLHVCCLASECQILTEADCAALGGDWIGDPLFQTCDPNPCPVPALDWSWGRVKARFRRDEGATR